MGTSKPAIAINNAREENVGLKVILITLSNYNSYYDKTL
jgi:hypothetical protein